MRNMSFSLTTEQVRARIKLVTRRLGWDFLKVGDRVQACVKCMGRKKGEPLVRICIIEVVAVTREKLRAMTDNIDYGFAETKLEGFENHPELCWPSSFVEFFCRSHRGCTPETEITRIQFKYA